MVVTEGDVKLHHPGRRPECAFAVLENVPPFAGEVMPDRHGVGAAANATRYHGADVGRRYVEEGRRSVVVVATRRDEAKLWELSLILSDWRGQEQRRCDQRRSSKPWPIVSALVRTFGPAEGIGQSPDGVAMDYGKHFVPLLNHQAAVPGEKITIANDRHDHALVGQFELRDGLTHRRCPGGHGLLDQRILAALELE